MEIQKINELNDELSSILSKLDKLESLKDIIKNSDNSDVEIQIRLVKKEKNAFVDYDQEILKITDECHKDIKELVSEHLSQLIFEKDQSIKSIISQLNDCTKIPEK